MIGLRAVKLSSYYYMSLQRRKNMSVSVTEEKEEEGKTSPCCRLHADIMNAHLSIGEIGVAK